MNRITFKQFIETFDFINIIELSNKELRQDTKIVRIYFPYDYRDINSWFEFGVSDFSDNMPKWDICKKIFSKEILDSYVTQISVLNNKNYEDTLTIFLAKGKDIDK